MTTADRDRCPTCDLPVATQADYDAHPSGCRCETCPPLCWGPLFGPDRCTGESVDWRARALAAEFALDSIAEFTRAKRREST